MTRTSNHGGTPPLLKLLHASLPYGTYRQQGDGAIHGLFYAAFVDYFQEEHGLDAQAHPYLSLDGIRDQLAAGRIVAAFVPRKSAGQPAVIDPPPTAMTPTARKTNAHRDTITSLPGPPPVIPARQMQRDALGASVGIGRERPGGTLEEAGR
jgi:hypothetical protein